MSESMCRQFLNSQAKQAEAQPQPCGMGEEMQMQLLF